MAENTTEILSRLDISEDPEASDHDSCYDSGEDISPQTTPLHGAQTASSLSPEEQLLRIHQDAKFYMVSESEFYMQNFIPSADPSCAGMCKPLACVLQKP
jgi:hypothetical protein